MSGVSPSLASFYANLGQTRARPHSRRHARPRAAPRIAFVVRGERGMTDGARSPAGREAPRLESVKAQVGNGFASKYWWAKNYLIAFVRTL